jgi:ABC-type transport system involved in multi-copper enzyme maturation permease subunit
MSGVVIVETIRRHVTNAGYLAFLGLVAIVAIAASHFDRTAAAWPTLIWLLAVVTGAGPIGPEFSSGTLQLILVKPLNRATYLLSRVAGVLCVVWLTALVAFTCEVIGRAFTGAIPWQLLGSALLNSLADTLLTVSLLVLLGSLTRAYFNAAIYVGTQIGISVITGVLTMAHRFPAVLQAIGTIDENIFPDRPLTFDRDYLLLAASNAAIALVLACFAFREREVPYGAD